VSGNLLTSRSIVRLEKKEMLFPAKVERKEGRGGKKEKVFA